MTERFSFKYELFLGNSTCRTCACAGTAADAGIGIDLKLAVSLGDSAYGALSGTCAARNTNITDYKSHSRILLKNISIA